MTEIIVHKGLKPRYWLRNLWWKFIVGKLFESYAKDAWKDHALIAYPIAIDIALGTMRLHYLKHGFYHVFKRINTYNHVMANRLSDRMAGKEEDDLSLKSFQRAVRLTNPVSVEKQLETEMQELEYY